MAVGSTPTRSTNFNHKRKHNMAEEFRPEEVNLDIDALFDRLPMILADDKDIQKSIDKFNAECAKYKITTQTVQKEAQITIQYVDSTGKTKTKKIDVPLLTICPIPYIPIGSIKLDFDPKN